MQVSLESGVVIVDDQRYVREKTTGDIAIVVLDRGFVYVGRFVRNGDDCELRGKNIIRWGTDKHLAQLASGPQENTRLGDCCHISFSYRDRVNHIIGVDQDAWKSHV